MPRRRRPWSIPRFLAVLLVLAMEPLSAARLQTADEPAVSEPGAREAPEAPALRCENVWYRPSKMRGRLVAWKLSGVLTLSPDELALTTPEETLTIPVGSIRSVAIGRMGIDLSNTWAIVEHGPATATEVAGFTPRPFSRQPGCSLEQIAQAIGGAVESRRQAAPTLPPRGEADSPAAPIPASQQVLAETVFDLVAEEGLKELITLSIPVGWSAHDQTKFLTGEPGPLGTVLYAPAANQFWYSSGRPEDAARLKETVVKLNTGEIPSLQLDRIPALRGTTCAGITPAAQRKIVSMVEGQDPMFARGHTVVEAPRATPLALSGVSGVRLRARSRHPEGVEWVLDLAAFGDGTTLYLFYAQAPVAHFERSREVLDRVLPTVRLTRCGARR